MRRSIGLLTVSLALASAVLVGVFAILHMAQARSIFASPSTTV